jgi:hypothetical protein
MPFPAIELVGPDGTRREDPFNLLSSVILENLPPQAAGSAAPQIKQMGHPHPVNLVVKATGPQQDAVHALLTAWREVWPLLWPAEDA